MTRPRHLILLLCLILGTGISVQARAGKFFMNVGFFEILAVDNTSSWSNSWVEGLVRAANRSTQEDCPFDPPDAQGLFRGGDAIFVSNYYMAWFDFTTNDGAFFPNPPYGPRWERSGELAGYWTLNPSTAYFRYWKTGPNGCWNWAHNELIPGSASPRGEKHWWDKYAPPTEHVLEVASGSNRFFMAFHYARHTNKSKWKILKHGSFTSAGVRYKVSARMTSPQLFTDVADGKHGNGTQNYIDAELEYICSAKGITSIWKFRPAVADVQLSNAFVYLWTAYAQDEDGTACDVGGSGSQWPSRVYGQNLYTKSSLSLKRLFGNNRGPFSPGSIVKLSIGPRCPTPHKNYDIVTVPSYAVKNKSWIRVGENSSISKSKPRFQYKNLGVPNSGVGSKSSPYVFPWQKLISWNETRDGTLGFGAGTGPFSDPSQFPLLKAGKWYQAKFTLRASEF